MAGVAAALAVPAGAAADTTGPVFHPPQQYYLALGDSLAFGFHEAQFESQVPPNPFTYDPASFNDGYDADLLTMLAPLAPPGQPPLTEVNYGCPGETTTSMIGVAGFPCPFRFQFFPPYILDLHDNYPAGDSQLQAALAFLTAHRGHVNPVTVDIGANDLLNLLSSCSNDATCIQNELPGTISTMVRNVDTILTAIQAAEPSAETLVMNVPDPFALYSPSSIAIFGAFDSALNAVVAAHNDRLVDAYSAGLQLVATDVPSWCEDSPAACGGPSQDIHPTAEGYMDLAEQFFSAAGYTSLPVH